jgi:hypothetical protein
LPQRALDGCHRVVASGDRDLLASLSSDYIVFRPPFAQIGSNRIMALAALGEEMGNRIGPQLSQMKAAAGARP